MGSLIDRNNTLCTTVTVRDVKLLMRVVNTAVPPKFLGKMGGNQAVIIDRINR